MSDIPRKRAQQVENAELEYVQEAEGGYEIAKEGKANLETQISGAPTLVSRSRKLYPKTKYEISFENGFLDAHISTFEIIFQKYWRVRDKIYLNEEFKQIQNYLASQDSYNYCQWMQDQIRNNENLSPIGKSQLIEDWKQQQNLCKYLKIITNKLSEELKSDIICLTSLIWQIYVQLPLSFGHELSNIKRMNQLLQSNINNLYWKNQLKNINCQQLGEPHKQAFQQFLSQYSQTIYLILQGYFDNPFSSNYMTVSSPTYQTQDWSFQDIDEAQLMGLPRKMPKLM